MFSGTIFVSIFNAIKVSQLQTELTKINQTWKNSNTSTLKALNETDFVKSEYNHVFYKLFNIIKEDNKQGKILSTKVPESIRVLLRLPPKDLDIDGTKQFYSKTRLILKQ
jgi:hypothetical protein